MQKLICALLEKVLRNIFSQQTFIKFIKDKHQTQYYSTQFHWHTPAEHTINSQKYDLQLHIVHENRTDPHQFAVVAILFEQDQTVSKDIFDEIDFMKHSDQHYPFVFKLENQYVYNYRGSLTVPSCDEAVQWFIFLNIYKIRPQNLNKFKQIINLGASNAREIQGLKGRQLSVIGGYCNRPN